MTIDFAINRTGVNHASCQLEQMTVRLKRMGESMES